MLINDSLKILLRRIADVFKLIFFCMLIVVVIQYMLLSHLTYTVVKEAEKTGYISSNYYNNQLAQSPLSKLDENVSVINVQPNFDSKVEKLGARVYLKLSKKVQFGNGLNFTITASKTGINQGFYGTGY